LTARVILIGGQFEIPNGLLLIPIDPFSVRQTAPVTPLTIRLTLIRGQFEIPGRRLHILSDPSSGRQAVPVAIASVRMTPIGRQFEIPGGLLMILAHPVPGRQPTTVFKLRLDMSSMSGNYQISHGFIKVYVTNAPFPQTLRNGKRCHRVASASRIPEKGKPDEWIPPRKQFLTLPIELIALKKFLKICEPPLDGGKARFDSIGWTGAVAIAENARFKLREPVLNLLIRLINLGKQ
jgi:hypothetical protein